MKANNDNNNLKITYAIKPSFTTRKIKELQQENKQLKDNWNKLKKWLNSFHKLSEFEQWEIVNKITELEGSDSNVKD